jgi:hypothetical protein
MRRVEGVGGQRNIGADTSTGLIANGPVSAKSVEPGSRYHPLGAPLRQDMGIIYS